PFPSSWRYLLVRTIPASRLLVVLAALGTTAALLAASQTSSRRKCGPLPTPWTTPVKLPGQVERGVFHGDSFYAVTGNGHLIAVDLKKQTVKDYGTLNTKLAPCIDVAGGQALVASSNKLHVVDLKSGKVVQTAPLMKEAVGLGFVGPSIFDSFICCGG